VRLRAAKIGNGIARFFVPETLQRSIDTGHTASVHTYALNQGMQLAQQYAGADRGFGRICVAAWSRDLASPDYAIRVLSAARRHGVDPSLIQLDCPMPWSRIELHQWLGTLETLRSVGVQFSMQAVADSAAHAERLQPAPFEMITLTGGLPHRLGQTSKDFDVEALSNLLLTAEWTGTALAAEDVEDKATVLTLRDLGFRYASGPYFGRYYDADALACMPAANLAERRVAESYGVQAHNPAEAVLRR
jgi:EAL domain-containing protein (putative c-di-GMP-specific phosphodiesterase class I)